MRHQGTMGKDVFLPNFSSFGFANASSYSKFVKLLQDISMTSQFHRNFFVKILLFNKFDKLFDLKVVTAFYESHFRHCELRGPYL